MHASLATGCWLLCLAVSRVLQACLQLAGSLLSSCRLVPSRSIARRREAYRWIARDWALNWGRVRIRPAPLGARDMDRNGVCSFKRVLVSYISQVHA